MADYINSQEMSIKCIETNNGGKFEKEFLRELGRRSITHEHTPPDMLQYKGWLKKCLGSSRSDNASYITCTSSCDAGCCSSSCMLSCGVPLFTSDSSLSGFTPWSSLPTLPVLSGPWTYCTACLSTIFLAFTSSTLIVLLGALRGISMNTHIAPFGATSCSRTLRRAYLTAPNGRKCSGVGDFPNHSSYGDISPSMYVVANLLVMSHAKSITRDHNVSHGTLMTSSR